LTTFLNPPYSLFKIFRKISHVEASPGRPSLCFCGRRLANRSLLDGRSFWTPPLDSLVSGFLAAVIAALAGMVAVTPPVSGTFLVTLLLAVYLGIGLFTAASYALLG
jgi:hypothetical protein